MIFDRRIKKQINGLDNDTFRLLEFYKTMVLDSAYIAIHHGYYHHFNRK